MSIENLEIDTETMQLTVVITELPTSCVIVICDGKAKLRELPTHGEYKIVTHQGKVSRMRREEGEEF